MNRQEAIQELKRMAATIEWDYPMDAQIAIEKAVEALSGPTPDPDTGLVPCGCRSKRICVAEEKNPFGQDRGWVAYCENCFVGTMPSVTKEAAVQIWNTAMGGQP